MTIGRHAKATTADDAAGRLTLVPVGASMIAIRLVGVAIGVTSFLNGFTEPNVGGRSDEIQLAMHVIDAVLSLAWAGWPIGMWLATTIGGMLVERFGTRSVLILGAICYWTAFALLGFVHGPLRFAVVMFFVGFGNGFFDVGANRLGPWLERRRQRIYGEQAGLANLILNGLFSAGSVLAALLTLIAVGNQVKLSWHLAAVGTFAIVVTVGWAAWFLPNLKGHDEEDGEVTEEAEPAGGILQRLRSTPTAVRWAGVLNFCAALPVGVGYVWSAILLKRLGAEGWEVPAGLLVFTSTEMLCRFAVGLLAKRVRVLRNPVVVTVAGGISALTGLALIVGPGQIALAVIGFGLLAGGMAPIGPLAQNAGQRLWPGRKGAASALITRYGYTALVLGPSLIGPLSSGLGTIDTSAPLRIALGFLAVLPVVVIFKAQVLRVARTDAIV